MPFGLGGFCVSGAKIKGVKYKNLNIHQQRSGELFDLIDGQGVIHEYVQLVQTDTNYQKLNGYASVDELLNNIFDDCFFIKTKDPNTLEPIFVYQYQSNVIKLSNGSRSYTPWDYINFCDATEMDTAISPSLSTLTASPTAVHPNGTEYSTLTLTLRNGSGGRITNVTSGVVFHVVGFSDDSKYTVSNLDYSDAANGVITAHLFGTEETLATVSASVDAINIDQTALVLFTGTDPQTDPIDPTQTTFVVPNPMNTDETYNIVITLRDTDGNLVKKSLPTNLHIESSDGNVVVGAVDYSQATTDGIIKIPVLSHISQTAYFLISIDGIILSQYGVMKFVEVVVPVFQVSISPSSISAYTGERKTFQASYVGTGIDNISKTGTWTTNAAAGDVSILSSNTNLLDIRFNKPGNYIITYTSSYDPSKKATASVEVILEDFTSVYSSLLYLDNYLNAYIGGGPMAVGQPVNPDTTMCIELKYFPESYTPTSYGTFSCSKTKIGSASFYPSETPFSVFDVSPDFTKIYIKFNKPDSAGNYKITLQVPHPGTSWTTSIDFYILLLNANGTVSPIPRLGTVYDSGLIGSAIKLNRSLPLSIVYSYAYNPTMEYTNLKPLPYASDVTFTTTPVDPTDVPCNISSDTIFTSSGSPGEHTISASFTDPVYDFSHNITITDDIPSQWVNITPYDMLIHQENKPVVIEANVLPEKYNSKDMIEVLTSNNTDPNLILDNTNKTIEYKTGYKTSSMGAISLKYAKYFPLNPVHTNPYIGSPMKAESTSTFRFLYRKSVGGLVDSFIEGQLYQFWISKVITNSVSSQENVIVSFSDESFFQKVLPLYYSSDNSMLSNNTYYRAMKSGLVTVTMFFPESNQTVVKDVYIFPKS